VTLGRLAVTVGWAGSCRDPDERPPRVPPFYADDAVTIWHGNALDLPLDDESVDLVVTSPPYFGLAGVRRWRGDVRGADRVRGHAGGVHRRPRRSDGGRWRGY
jgi:DNA modification methylase